MLKLTYKELEDIVADDDERFEVLHDKIPYDSTDPKDDPMNYIEDDGRQYRYFEFRDTVTGETYNFSYTWHSEWSTEFPLSFLGDPPVGIEFVKESVINPPKAPEPVVEILSPEAQADKDLWAQYKELESAGVMREFAKGMVPTKTIKELKVFLKTQKFNMYELRAKFIPVCIEHKVEQKSFWQFIQGWKKV